MSAGIGVLRMQAVLAANPGSKMQGFALAKAAGVKLRDFHRHASALVKRNKFSRVKIEISGSGHYWYFLNEEQLRIYQQRKALALVTQTEDVPDRLKFLRMLKEKTVFGEHAMLALIISDYERTIKLRADAEDRIDQQSARERRNTAPMRSCVQPSRGQNP